MANEIKQDGKPMPGSRAAAALLMAGFALTACGGGESDPPNALESMLNERNARSANPHARRMRPDRNSPTRYSTVRRLRPCGMTGVLPTSGLLPGRRP